MAKAGRRLKRSFYITVTAQLNAAYTFVEDAHAHQGSWGVYNGSIKYTPRALLPWTLWYVSPGRGYVLLDRNTRPRVYYWPKLGKTLSGLIAWHQAYLADIGHDQHLHEKEETPDE